MDSRTVEPPDSPSVFDCVFCGSPVLEPDDKCDQCREMESLLNSLMTATGMEDER